MNTQRFFKVLIMGVLLSCAGGDAGAQGAPVATDGSAELFQKSYNFEALGKLQDALVALDQLPASRRDSYVAQLRRGWLLLQLGRSAAAVDAYARAIALAPKAVEARVGVLVPLMALRRWADAEKQGRELLKIDPKSYLGNLRLAFALYNLGRFSESVTLYHKLAELYPSDVEVRAGLGWALLKSGQAVEGAREFAVVLEIAPKNLLALEGLKALEVR